MPNNSYISLYQLPKLTSMNSQDSILLIRNRNLYKIDYNTFINQITQPTLHSTSITFENQSNIETNVSCSISYIKLDNPVTYLITPQIRNINVSNESTIEVSDILSEITNGILLSVTVTGLPSSDNIELINLEQIDTNKFQFINAESSARIIIYPSEEES